MASNKYKEDNDAFAAFAQEVIVKEAGSEIRANDLMIRYKEWTKFNPGKKLLQKKDVLTRMEEVYGKPIDPAGKIFAGVRLVEEGEESENPAP
jgi:hypothetical protein